MDKYDIAVIGAGPGGYPAAARAGQLGAKVALIEKEHLGGECLNWGCIPTKAIICATELFHKMKHAQTWGLSANEVAFDYAAMMDRNQGVITNLRDGVAKMMRASGVDIIPGTGFFVDRKHIAIAGNDGNNKVIEAGKVIIATGSETMMPDYLPEHERVMGSRQFLGIRKAPKKLIVMGSGVIACEFTCAMAQLGVEVTLVKRKHRDKLGDILRGEDADLVKVLRDYMTNDLGVTIYAGDEHEDKSFENIHIDGKHVVGEAGPITLKADILLAAIGRVPFTKGLNLDKIGLQTNKRGYIEIGDYCETSVPGIYAIGDVTPGSQLAHGATAEGMAAAENACGHRVKREKLVPGCIFTCPEIAAVGMKEKEAREKKIPIVKGVYPFEGLGKSVAVADTRGFAKWIANAETGQILGASAVGAHATDLIAEGTMAVRQELTVEEVARTVHCHPTVGEVWMEAAHMAVVAREMRAAQQ